MTLRNIVVVGGSIGAVTAAQTLRLEGFEGSITILSQESVPPYTRVPLSKGILAGRESLADSQLPTLPEDIELRLNTRAIGLDVARRIVRTDVGDFEWDGLVIATGARARRLAPHLRELVVRDHRDCADLRAELARVSSALIVGGGFLGMEIASTLRELGKAVTVIDREPPMQRLLGPTVAARVREVAQAAGVQFHIDGGGIELIGKRGARPESVATSSGETLEADVVISAAGDTPNTEWLDGSGIDRADGVRVDSRCRVRSTIVAAGDVASQETSSGQRIRIPSWTNAIDQSRAAARTLLHGDDSAPYTPSHYMWTEQFGLDIKTSGPLPSDSELTTDDGWESGTGSLLVWGPSTAPKRVLGWNHHLRPAQLKRMAGGGI